MTIVPTQKSQSKNVAVASLRIDLPQKNSGLQVLVVRVRKDRVGCEVDAYEKRMKDGSWVRIHRNEIQQALRRHYHVLWNPEVRRRQDQAYLNQLEDVDA